MRSPIVIRASSLGELLDCPHRWQSKHVDGKTLPRSAAAQLGTAVHASTAKFDEGRLPGGDVLSVDDAAGALVDAIHRPEGDVQWDETSPLQAEAIGLALHRRYCVDVAPTQRYRAVELRCERLDIPDLAIALTGTTDRVRETPAGAGIADLKTGARAVSADGRAVTQGHAMQLGVYELLAEHASGVPITAPAQVVGLQTGKTAVAQRVGVAEVASPRTALVGAEGSMGLLEFAARIVHDGLFWGNPRSMLCHRKYCAAYETCRFRT